MLILSGFLLVCLLYPSLGDLPNVAKGVWLDSSTKNGARCLDGSPPLYYIRPGSSANSTKWVIHQQGGAWCTSIDDCYNRSLSILGSSNPKYGWQPTMDFAVVHGCNNARWCGGLFVNDPTKNPLSYDWNAVFLVYCDGGSQVGTYSNPIPYKNSNLYFSGYYVLNSIIDDLIENQGMSKATEIIVGGDSAGGLSTWLHVDLWGQKIKEWKKKNSENSGVPVRIVGTPDSGFFLNLNSKNQHYSDNMKWVFKTMNGTTTVNPNCVSHFGVSDDFLCFFAENIALFIDTPVFVLQSKFDEYQLGAILGSKVAADVNPFGVTLTTKLNTFLEKSNKSGAFIDSCVHHCGGWGIGEDGDYRLVIDGETGITAFIQWYTGGTKKIWNQGDIYPCTLCCTGGGRG